MLSQQDKKKFRAIGHHLKPVVTIAGNGLSESVLAEIERALADHELIKVRRGSECPDSHDEVAAALTKAVGAELVQKLGRTLLIYRRHPEEPAIVLPRARKVASSN